MAGGPSKQENAARILAADQLQPGETIEEVAAPIITGVPPRVVALAGIGVFVAVAVLTQGRLIVVGGIPLVLTMNALAKWRSIVVTNQRVMFLENSIWTNKARKIEWALPRSSATIAESTKDRLVLAYDGGRLKLHGQRGRIERLRRVLVAFDSPDPPPAL